MTHKIHITRPLPQAAVDLLKEAGVEVTIPDHDEPPSRNQLLERVKDVHGILSILTERIDKEVLRVSPELKVVSNMAVGYDNIDVEAATERGIAVCNTPGVLTETTADFAWALLLATARRVVECHQFVAEGRFHWWGPKMMMGTDIWGKTLGIVGLGKIGRAVARRAAGFRMEVLHHGGRGEEADEVSLQELLKRSDFVSLHVPYNDSTHHLIDEQALKLMKKEAFLINTARGAVVDEEALVQALNSRQIRGAGLDVFEEEPQVHPELMTMPQVVLAPHAASASLATRERMAVMAAKNLLAVLQGEEPSAIVNQSVLER